MIHKRSDAVPDDVVVMVNGRLPDRVSASSRAFRTFKCIDDHPLFRGGESPPLRLGAIYKGVTGMVGTLLICLFDSEAQAMRSQQFCAERFIEVR